MEAFLDMLKKLGAKDEDIAAARNAYEADVQGLKNKNSELLGEVRKLKNGDNTQLTALQEKIDTLESDNVKLSKELKSATSKLDTVTKGHEQAIATEKAAIVKLVKEAGIANSITALQIKKEFVPAVTALLSSKVDVLENGTERKAIVKAVKDGKEIVLDLSDYIKEWSGSEEGKAFVPASANSGGGATGGSTNGAGKKTMTQSAWEKLPPVEQTTFVTEGGSITEG